ncbi:phosphoribosylamine--glycine ligase [Solibaculum mannosilyticum]|uniref:Phosphoribosylamine--glycine ligase n=1 Tax=Solibaculum mannosilyticum TaxID=2780922 RepID=A0A7I8D150_9FIRM|nr:phosphoribosylamine--glycine ligase [Solibaculum mannosilyticum]BCI60518.1 phosphoribosylamine--glycine ligase [Solibaculum mannosilyticum]
MKILMVGGGGREHALIRKLKESPKVTEIHCAPGNGGISKDAQCHNVSVDDMEGMVRLAKEIGADLVVVAPDNPLVDGMVDEMEKAGLRCFGPNQKAAILEGSKVFSKSLMKQYGIPTAGYHVFEDPKEALQFIREEGKYPTVIKADGLALGKGVVIAADETEAAAALHSIMEDKIFGASGNRVIVEEFITGPEVSVLSFTDGKTVKPMVSSMDHKRVFDGNLGPNTGGMGTISPNPYYDDATAKRCMEEIFLPTIQAMSKEGRPFKGCLYFGLMLTADGPKVIEYNCRFGDPEAQVVLPRLKTDLVDIMNAVIDEKLDELDIQWSEQASACVILASGGYPGKYEKNIPISGLDENGQVEGAIVYHAGTQYRDNTFVTAGGRVLGITAMGDSLDQALDNAYEAVQKVRFDGAHYRTDIGRVEYSD